MATRKFNSLVDRFPPGTKLSVWAEEDIPYGERPLATAPKFLKPLKTGTVNQDGSFTVSGLNEGTHVLGGQVEGRWRFLRFWP